MTHRKVLGILVTIALTHSLASTSSAQDQDADSILDADDNCVLVPNRNQIDSDNPQDGFGNACDADLTNDGVMGGDDFSIHRGCALLGALQQPFDSRCDTNANGIFDNIDRVRFRRSWRREAPGPSGIVGER